ncbi:MAG: Uma2 family endonuclease [Thermomicrobiales bacterium]
MVVADVGISAATYERVALRDPDGQWELHHGQLREKPTMSFEHNDVMAVLPYQLHAQLDRLKYRILTNGGRLRVSERNYYIPDVTVVPTEMVRALRDRPGRLEMYADPLPLVVEIWSPSTGSYDIQEKLAGYQERGDLEIWRVHPYERTLTAWRRQPDGSYDETLYPRGTVESVSLPGVVIDLATLFS